jgi:hypothetical protein
VPTNHKIQKGTELMKKIISVIITITMLAALLAATAIGASADAPVECKDWEEFAQKANLNYGEGNFKLMSDSVCETSVEGFFGTFDGNGHTITVKNTMFVDVSGGAIIANFTATNTEAIDKCPIILAINGSFEDAPVLLENITNNVNVDASGNTNRVAGIVGSTDNENYITFKNCVNNGNIISNEQAGGIIGNADLAMGYLHANFIDCVNNGDITTSIHYAAGIVGNVNQHCDFMMVRCINTGDITAREMAGGLISRILGGKANVIMYKCANTGNITTTDKASDKYGVAGLVSRTTSTSTISVYDSFVSGVYSPFKTVDETTGELLSTAGADPICQYPSTGIITLENVKILHNPVVAGASAYTASETATGFEYTDKVAIDAGVAAIMADFGKPYDVPGTTAPESEETEDAGDETTAGGDVTTAPTAETTPKVDTTPATAPATTPAPTVTTAAEEGGCGSSISLAIVAVAAVGAVAIARKKD